MGHPLGVQMHPPNGCTHVVPLNLPLGVPMRTTSKAVHSLCPLAAIELLEGLTSGQPPLLPRRLPASRIELLPLFNSRTYRDDDVVAGMLAALAAGEALPPLVVYAAGQRVFLMDGHMRLDAHRRWAEEKNREGTFTVPVVTFAGKPAEAVLSSIERNAKHGVRLSKVERTDAAWKLVVIDRGLTRSQIAAGSGVSPRTVNTMRSTRRELGVEAEEHSAWLDARLALTRTRDLSVDDMLDLQAARAERAADQFTRAVGSGLADEPSVLARAMLHYTGRKWDAFVEAVVALGGGEPDEDESPF